MNPTNELTLDPPCAGRLEGLFALAIDREAADPRLVAATRAHASKCANCTAFLRSQQELRRTIRTGFERWPTIGAIPRRSVGSAFDRRLEEALDRSDAAEFATRCCRLGHEILSLDIDYSIKTVSDGEGCVEGSRPIARLERSITGLLAIAGSRDALVESLRTIDLPKLASDRDRRVEFVGSILRIADRGGRRGSSDVSIARANLEWNYGDTAAVGGHLERALTTARTCAERSEALSSLALLAMDSGDFALALSYSDRALDARPEKPLALLNRFRWESMAGSDNAMRWLDRLIGRDSGQRFLSVQRRAWHRQCLEAVGDRIDVEAVSRRRRASAALRALDAACGAVL